MAYQIIQHRIDEPKEYAVRFQCKCGFEFWVDKDYVDTICIHSKLGTVQFFYRTECSECKSIVCSCSTEEPVPY